MSGLMCLGEGLRSHQCISALAFTTTMSAAISLKDVWQSSAEGRLSPAERMKAWAWKQVCASRGLKLNAAELAGHLKTSGTPGGNPEPQSVRELLAKIDGDADWFPGKSHGASNGPAPALNAAKRRCIAQSAMSIEQNGGQAT